MSDNYDREGLAALAEVVATLAEEKRDPRVPTANDEEHAPEMILNDGGVPIVMGGEAVDFEHRVKLSQVAHPATIEVSTLQAIVDFWPDEVTPGSFIKISDHSLVQVLSSKTQADGSRTTYLEAGYIGVGDHFDEWMAVDEFSTWLLSAFVPNTGSEALYAALGRGVKAEAVREAGDGRGGFEVKTREGARFEWLEDAGPRFQLAYICTFPEVPQPERACVARCRNSDDGIQVKLVDADGGAWRQKVIASIAAWLRKHDELKGVTILG